MGGTCNIHRDVRHICKILSLRRENNIGANFEEACDVVD
jgi:hypothetical protein